MSHFKIFSFIATMLLLTAPAFATDQIGDADKARQFAGARPPPPPPRDMRDNARDDGLARPMDQRNVQDADRRELRHDQRDDDVAGGPSDDRGQMRREEFERHARNRQDHSDDHERLADNNDKYQQRREFRPDCPPLDDQKADQRAHHDAGFGQRDPRDDIAQANDNRAR